MRPALPILVVLLAAAPGLASAEPPTLTFENATGQKVIHLYAECLTVTDCDWDDLLGDRVLEPGETIRLPAVSQDDRAGCARHYRAELPDLATVRVNNVDSCRSTVIRFGPPPAR